MGANSFCPEPEQSSSRISIVLQLCSDSDTQIKYFALFDGFKGNGCASFLQANLHELIVKSKDFPRSLERALVDGFEKAEAEWL